MKNGGPLVWEAMQGLVAGAAQALEAVEVQLPQDFPERIWEPISRGIRSQAERFLSEASTLY